MSMTQLAYAHTTKFIYSDSADSCAQAERLAAKVAADDAKELAKNALAGVCQWQGGE